MKKKPVRNYILFILTLVFFIMLVLVGIQKHTYMGFHTDVAMTYNQGWQQVGSSGRLSDVSIPGVLSYDANHEIVLQHELPQHIMSGLSICVWVSGPAIKAEIDGEQVLSYGVDDGYVFGKHCGNYWCMIRLPESAEGKILKITMSSSYEMDQYHLDHIYIGNQTSLMFMLFEQCGVGLFLALLLFLTGIVIATVSVVFHKRMAIEDIQQMHYLGLFSVLLGMWMFVQARMAQFFVGNNFVLVLIYYMGMMLLPIPILYFMAQIPGNHLRRPTMVLSYLFVLNFIVCSVLQFADIKDFGQTVYSTVILMVLALVFMLLNAIVELHYRNKDFICVSVGVFFLAFFSAIELWSVVCGQNYWIGDYVRYGAVCFVAALLYKVAHSIVNTVEADKTAAYYEQLATIDLVTQCYSRTAYHQDVEKLSQETMADLCFLVLNINHLKKINDIYGQLAGDKAIKTCALCIRRVFERVGKVYRIGGDEFAVILTQCDKDMLLQRIAVFQKLVDGQNKRLEFEFKVACGYAIYDSKHDRRIEDLIHRADASMYERKQRMKAEG